MAFILVLNLVFSVFQSDNLVKTKVTDNITMLIPADFRPMTDDEIASKYFTVRKPMMLYTDPNLIIDLGVNQSTTSWNAKDVEIMASFQKANIFSLYDEVNIISEGTKEVNGWTVVYYEFESSVLPNKNAFVKQGSISKYIYIQYLIIGDKSLVFNFTCPARLKTEWSEKAANIMNSITIKGKIK